jgi:spermidine synthase
VPDDWGLKLLVFTAGGVLMGLEIAGSRVLAPHFGNSVFVWGSLISVFLIALSVGYYFGGRLADRHPSRVLLNAICLAVALAIVALALCGSTLCGDMAAWGLGERTGPLVASMVLFLPPSVGMGMVSPFAIRLAASSVSSVGKTSGMLYALSTAGSIVGTLVTTFVLIPLVGLSAVLKGLGLTLLVVSAVTFPFRRGRQTPVEAAALGITTILCLILPGSPPVALGDGEISVADFDTPYHHIAVVDRDAWRELRFDRYVESTILLEPPYPSPESYTDYFHLAFLANSKLRRVVVIGAGGGVGPRAFHMHDPTMEIDVVDIDPKVIELAYTHFFLDHTPQIRTFAEDGRRFLRKAQGNYDAVILDAFTIGGRIPFHLVTREFLEICREKMTEDGLFVVNLNSALEGPLAGIFRSMYRTSSAVFPQTYVFAKDHRHWGRGRSMNVILVASKRQDPIPPEQWVRRAALHHSDSYVGRLRMQTMVQDLLHELPDLTGAPLFTDDYAPIETMPFSESGT